MSKERQKINPILKLFFPLVDCIADLFGSNCEVVLHDVSGVEKSIIKIRNGHVTGRKLGNPMTDVGLEMIKKANEGLVLLGNYNPRTETGKLLKSNAINIKDPNNKLIGILCINYKFFAIQRKKRKEK
jgi:predicted transcriptional regulator YheO